MITLKSDILTVKTIHKKTTAYFFKDLKIGDQIVFSIPLKGSGINSRGGIYASYLTVENLTAKDARTISFNQLSHILGNFELI